MSHRTEHRHGRDASDRAAAAREIVDSNLYLTLATADAGGRPWASPVWFAHEGYREFFWVSRPGARHSRNLAAHPDLALVIFDLTAAPVDAAAVYVEGRGEELEGRELERAIAIYSRRSSRVPVPRCSEVSQPGLPSCLVGCKVILDEGV